MPITSIITQPATNSISAAYRPITFRIAATATTGSNPPPVVYCDIYLGAVFYKTLSKTQPASAGQWEFDIQDATQEYLRKYIAPNGGGQLYNAARAMTKAFCRFRSSGLDANGFILPEGTIPVQGTGNQVPVPGTGTESNSLYVVNATLQHEDSQDLASHLNSYKVGNWVPTVYPQTHRPANYLVHAADSDFFPIINTADSPLKSAKLHYRYKGQTTFLQDNYTFENACPIVIPQGTDTLIDSGTAQTLELWWNTMPYYVTGVKIEYRIQDSTDDWIVQFAEPNPGAHPVYTVDRGEYDVWFTAIGNCEGGRTGYLKIGS